MAGRLQFEANFLGEIGLVLDDKNRGASQRIQGTTRRTGSVLYRRNRHRFIPKRHGPLAYLSTCKDGVTMVNPAAGLQCSQRRNALRMVWASKSRCRVLLWIAHRLKQ